MLQERMSAMDTGSEPSGTDPDDDGPIRVFLVEDHEIVREGTRRLIEADGDIQVVGEADSGEDAVNAPELSAVQVVLCDMMLPGIDGIDTLRQMLARHPHLKVVMLSTFGEDHLLHALDAGAVGYLLKKAGQEELSRAVRDAAAGGAPLSPSLSTVLVSRLRDSGSGGPLDLSARQKDVLRMVAKGDSTKEIADQLFMSPATVKRELRAIFDRLGVGNRAHAVAQAQQRGII
ncbi:MAG: response regulator transcription factor [Chloroflexi bacterium]|nr:response regulator transcription factor [Chloroflexota bacterium]